MKLHEIRTENLILRELNPQVIKPLFEECTGPEAFHLLGCRSEEDYFFIKDRYHNHYVHSPRLSFRSWLLIGPESGRLIGDCSFHNWWLYHEYAEVGYGIWDEMYRNRGLMSEALGKVLEIGFGQMGLQRIEAFVKPQNKASIRVLEKLGFRLEGLLKKRYREDGKMADTFAFGLLKEQYISKEPVSWVRGLLASFENHSLPSTAWTHDAHLAVGLWYLLEDGMDAALCKIREGVISYNLASGRKNTPEDGYHETLTVFWMHILNRFVEQFGKGQPYEKVYSAFLLSPYSEKNLPLQYYSLGRIRSVKARAQWVEPDLQPLEEEPNLMVLAE